MYNFVKKILDFSLSLLLIILFSPILIFISILVYFDLGAPIIFKQARGGLKGKSFLIYKFKTMKNSHQKKINYKDDILRTSRLGKILRKYSLDELPTLINVLNGSMSFVGPRPLLEEYNKIYNDNQRKRFDVKPGITGWAQINGRNSISWEEKFILDIWYVENKSILLDLKIMLKTIIKIIKNNDVNSNEHNTMTKFKKRK
jgi:lipopolysaccharide/colanic/teichoic acid biosynthesis glycosyltransferase